MRMFLTAVLWMVGGSVQANIPPQDINFPCSSNTRVAAPNELQFRSSEEFISASSKAQCQTQKMTEALYVYGGHTPPDLSSIFDERIYPPENTLTTTQRYYTQHPTDISGILAYTRDLLRSKQYPQVIALLEPLYRESDNPPLGKKSEPSPQQKASIAKMLAYAYELEGNFRTALKWAYRRNAVEESDSAWFHVQILTNKVNRGEKGIRTRSVLNLPFRESGLKGAPIALSLAKKPASLRQTIDVMANVLYERVEFYPKDDAVTSSLLFDLGYLIGLNGAFEDAQYVLRLAEMYGDPDASQAQQYFQWKEIQHNALGWILFVLAALGVVAIWWVVAGICRWGLRYCSQKNAFQF